MLLTFNLVIASHVHRMLGRFNCKVSTPRRPDVTSHLVMITCKLRAVIVHLCVLHVSFLADPSLRRSPDADQGAFQRESLIFSRLRGLRLSFIVSAFNEKYRLNGSK